MSAWNASSTSQGLHCGAALHAAGDGLQELSAFDALDSSPVVKNTGSLPNKASYDIRLDLSLFGLRFNSNVSWLVSAKCYSVAI